jgi:transketolase
MLLDPPYTTTIKPYGRALVELGYLRQDVVCLSADLTRQTETDLFRDTLGERFFNVGMAEQNMMGIAAGLARAGYVPYVHTFGVFATRRCYDQIAMSIAYPNLKVRIVGFMPGLSSPGGPSHQAIDDVALMRALPNMTVIDVGDARETGLVVKSTVDHEGPVYIRLKRGDIPEVLSEEYEFRLDEAAILSLGDEVVVVASGMMLSAAAKAAQVARDHGISTAVLYVPVIKPIDGAAIINAITPSTRGVITAENHSIVGGLGSAVAEVLAAHGASIPLRRVGVADRFAEPGDRPYLFAKYGLGSADIVGEIWRLCRQGEEPPALGEVLEETSGSFEPV